MVRGEADASKKIEYNLEITSKDHGDGYKALIHLRPGTSGVLLANSPLVGVLLTC